MIKLKFKSVDAGIPFDRRKDINSKILSIVQSGTIPHPLQLEDIFNGYTGIGGLHDLNRSDFENYYEYSKEKKIIEQGQFFTNSQLVYEICKHLPIEENDYVCDLSCGAGAFINAFPEDRCYGCDLDINAINVAKFCFPNANIECCDIRFYTPPVKFNFIVGNPPFNLRWAYKDETYLSQHFYCLKAAELLNPGGILMCIVPDDYLKDEFFQKGMVQEINERFNFVFQYKLDPDSFANMGVVNYKTKVLCLQIKSEHLKENPYSTKYIKPEEVESIFLQIKDTLKPIKLKLHRETLQRFSTNFNFKAKKYLFEIKTHPVLKPFYSTAINRLHALQNQKKPDNVSNEEWEKTKLTENKVLAFYRTIIQKQSIREEKRYAFVKTNYTIKIKPYSRSTNLLIKKEFTQTVWDISRMISLRKPAADIWPKWLQKLYNRKRAKAINQQMLFSEMQTDSKINQFLSRFAFLKSDNTAYRLKQTQIDDLNLLLQKNYGILNWQQGCGKTPASAAWIKYKPLKNTFIVGPAIALELTWEPFLKLHKKQYKYIRTISDVQNLKPGDFVLVTTDYAISLKIHLKKYIKRISHKASIVFDESDEITNPNAKRTYATLSLFRKLKRKLLATGTTTRNNITEIYSQLELLYNNSTNLSNTCSYYYIEEKDPDTYEISIKRKPNPYFHYPFPARGGSVWFKRCFNPSKSTVFGIQKHDQRIYNEPELKRILEYTIITKKFKDIAGNKYAVAVETVYQNEHERRVYKTIIEETTKVINQFYSSTGNSKKDAMLRMLRQLQLLINATSMPQTFVGYDSKDLPNKSLKIFEYIEKHETKLAIGCTSIEGVDFYCNEVQKRFPFRPLFKVVGEYSFTKRNKIREVYEASTNGILICTQQSLKSSVNIPSCSLVLIESKQWNIPKIEQFFFRFIRLDSNTFTNVVFFNYHNTIEMNLMALLMSKERLNDYIKTLEYKDNSDIYQEYNIDLDILNSIITKSKDEEGHVKIQWGEGEIVD